MMKICLASLLILMLSFLCYPQYYGADYEYISGGVRQPLAIHRPKEEAKILKDHWQAIGEEIKTTDSLLAGTYTMHGYRGWYLRWSPKNGFVYIYHYEDIDIIDYSYGRVEAKGSEVTFIPEREMQETFRNRKLSTPKSWLVLGLNFIPKAEIKSFADYLSGLNNFNNWNCDCSAFFIRSFEPKEKIKGPEFIIPRQYKHFFKPPVEGKIIFVGKSNVIREPNMVPQIVTPLKINVGKGKGVKKGMLLRLFIDDYTNREIEIKKVYGDYSLGTITDGIFEEEKGLIPTYYNFETKKDEPLPPLRIGTKVTTKLFSY